MSRVLSLGRLRVASGLPGLLLGCASSVLHAQAAYQTGYVWDNARRIVGQISPAADPTSPSVGPYIAIRYTYDSNGRLSLIEKGSLSTWQATTVPTSWTGFTIHDRIAYSYDGGGDKIETRLSGGDGTVLSVTQSTYDPNWRLSCSAVRMNLSSIPGTGSNACALGTPDPNFGSDRITKTIYDAAGQVVQTRRAIGTILELAYATYTYTPNGNKQDVIDAIGNHSQFVYDGFDRKQKWIFPSKTLPTAFNGATPATAVATAGALNSADVEQWAYDNNDNVTTDTKRSGQNINYSIDPLNRVYRKYGASVAAVDYTYDLLGHQLTSTYSSTGAGVTSTYDKVGRLQTSTDTSGGSALQLSYIYDANSNRIRVTHPDTTYFTYDYDALNRVKAIKENGVTAVVTPSYFDWGARSSLARTNGATTSYTYDGISRLATLAEAFVNGTGNVTANLSYNPASQITGYSRNNDAYAYADTPSLSRPYSVNGLNQYTQTGPSGTPTATFAYDATGNLTGSTDTASNTTTTYTYDVENRLTGASGGKTATLVYDPNGRLVQIAGASGTTRLLYDGDALVAEYGGSSVLRRYVNGIDADEPLVWYEGSTVGSSDRRFFHADHEGSVVAVSDASGNSIKTNTYDEYGIPGVANQNLVQRFQYTGQIFIPELGLYHYKARAYSPTLGRFMQTDPAGYDDQINLYAYVVNDPINNSDSSGRQTFFYGGAGNDDSATYKSDFIKAFNEAGIKDSRAVPESSTSNGMIADLIILPFINNKTVANIYTRGVGPGNDPKEQYNLVGYSYGTLLASQQALTDSKNGRVVDHLVLIGAPMNSDLQNAITHDPNIRSVTFVNIAGDPIRPGMTDGALALRAPIVGWQMLTGTGHFTYAGSSPAAAAHRRELAKELYKKGLR